MTELGVGALPICGTDNKLKGMLTDRDIVVKLLGAGKDPGSCTAGDLAQCEAVTIGADDDASEIMSTMTAHQVHKVRRLPVIDGHDLVGELTEPSARPGRGCRAPARATARRGAPAHHGPGRVGNADRLTVRANRANRANMPEKSVCQCVSRVRVRGDVESSRISNRR